ncbi:MAG TPA: kelch repeat-containing protein [candidate division Zixibacteria bacterium]|nr:T9SS type A sorting domain-containing protein [candidate division Zixibacteria bacterium]MDD4917722.1 kelch repeat-containing protein [candidate division Zixibacteria bacterium]MDM7971712.1 kelch repeat-containing protein [candidate division Zixibacteria bacterium]HPM36898.1 kelch repeat-containing protein [candidate division Zixibacteria bacterium]
MYASQIGRQTEVRIGTTILILLLVLLPFASTDAQPSGTWSERAPMPTARAALPAVALGGRIYAISGDVAANVQTPQVERYDPTTNSWENVAPLPTARGGLSATVYDGKIYAVGGQFRGGPNPANFSDDIEVYDPLTNSWSALAPMTTRRTGLAVVALRGKIYAIGGYQEGHSPQVMNIVEVYDPATNTWSPGTPMQMTRCAFNCAVVNDKIYAISGLDGTGGATETSEVYDPDTDTWTYIAPIPKKRSWSACDTLDGQVAIVGGYLPYDLYPDLWFYDPMTNTWSQSSASLPTPRHACGGASLNGTLYVVGGGLGYDPSVLNTVEAYEISSVAVAVDIKPGSCPNPLNLRPYREEIPEPADNESGATGRLDKQGPRPPRAVLPVAILGTAEFDPTMIDWTTVMLAGVSPIRFSLDDVATPVPADAVQCQCTTAGPDGYTDMTLKFYRDQIIAALGQVYAGDTVALALTGNLLDGTPIEGTDCVHIINGPEPPEPPLAADDQTPVLLGNYPNPFNPATQIGFSLPAASHVTLVVYNIMGQQVAVLADGQYEAGDHSVTWDASAQSSGVYLYLLDVSGFSQTRKMLLLK